MILIFEQDTRNHGKGRFNWRPQLFRGSWRGFARTWRFGWGMWAVSYYPEPGLREFLDHVPNTAWHERSH